MASHPRRWHSSKAVSIIVWQKLFNTAQRSRKTKITMA
jgi:hypothetical protein